MSSRDHSTEFKEIDIDEDSIYKLAVFLRKIYGASSIFSKQYLSWLYKENPNGSVVGYNAFNSYGEIIAHYALVPINANIQGVNERVLLSLNTATAEEARGKGLFTILANKSYDLGKSKSYGAVIGVANQNSSHGFVNKLGFQNVCSLDAKFSFGVPQFIQKESQFSYLYDKKTLEWRLNNPSKKYKIYRKKEFIIGYKSSIFMSILKINPYLKIDNTSLKYSKFIPPSIKLWIGKSNCISWKNTFSFNLPTIFRPSPLNLIFKDLSKNRKLEKEKIHFECINFDAY